MRSYQVASSRIVLDADTLQDSTGRRHVGRVVLNVTDGQARSVTVQDRATGKALVRIPANRVADTALFGSSDRDHATLAGFLR